MISAESGTGKKGKTYRYYKCGNKKRGSKCELSPVRQDVLETAVIEATKRDMLTDETIAELVKRIMILQDEEEASDYSAILKNRLEDAEKRRKNLLRLVEASGDMDLDGVPERLAEISQEIKDLKGEIIKEELSKVHYSEKVIRLWLETFRDADFGNEKTRKQFVETFIDHIEIKNGEALIFYNMQEKAAIESVRIRLI